jgi:hypothetical protein
MIKEDLEFAARYDSGQVAYVSSKFFEDFYCNALGAVITSALPQVRKSEAKGAGDTTYRIADATLTYSSEDGGSLQIMFDHGEGALLRWRDSSDERMKQTEIDVEHYSLRLPPETLARREQLLGSGATLRQMLPLAVEFARDGHPYCGANDANGGYLGQVSIVAFNDRPGIGKGSAPRSCQRIDLLQKIASTLDLSSDEGVEFEARDHLQLARDGMLLPMFASAAALAFETDIIAQLPELTEIVSLSDDLKLGSGTMLAHGDGDRLVYGVSTEAKDIVVHNNIDLNEKNVFVLVLNKDGGAYASVDIYIAQSWFHTFEDWTEKDLDDRADGRGFNRLVEFTSEQQKRPNEDVLVAAILAGRPEQGLAYSYDIATGSLELGAAAYRTGFLPYARMMIEKDLEALRKLRSGDHDHLSVMQHAIGCSSLDDEEDIEPSDYLESLGLDPIQPTI